ncbi:MAG: type II CRISPR RNA-guided endonuclease Cas9, partial [Spirochaetia bacterium]|nr:type II CRISPR RNA-guided endonuclease Cas9 [Spirochaetia bacterium]
NKYKKPEAIINSGVRIFPDSMEVKVDVPKNARRREKRSQRRNSDRYKARRENLMNALVNNGFMPKDIEKRKELEILDPYEIRYKAVNEKISIYEAGRALFHINQRRGFKSNRKADARDSESGVLKKSIFAFKEEMNIYGTKTAGELLYKRRTAGKTVLAKRYGTKSTDLYEVYVDRALVEDEIKTIWEVQSSFSPELYTAEAYREISSIILDQRPLQPPAVGRCSCEPNEPRASKSLPIAQRFRLLQLITDMHVIYPDYTKRRLTLEEQQKMLRLLLTTGSSNFNTLRSKLGFDSSIGFSHEHMDKIIGDETAGAMRTPSGKKWDELSPAVQTEIVKFISDAESDEAVEEYLINNHDFSADEAGKMAKVNLPVGRMAFCEKVLDKLCKNMEEGRTLREALKEEGYGDRNPILDGSMDSLPYYGEVLKGHIMPGTNDKKDHYEIRIGKITNPVVHVGLNQLRKVVNLLIDTYGKPDQIVIELARELKMNREQKGRYIKSQKENEKRNNDLDEKYLKPSGIKRSRDILDKLKMWEELSENPLDRCCPYCGGTLNLDQVLGAESEVEHILPFKRTLDNSMANKTISHRKCNRDKGDKSPYEAFGSSDKWLQIAARADRMPPNKKWRFQSDAMDRFDGENDFIARQLTDTQYFTRMAQLYLTAVCKNVWSVPGGLTALVRRQTGLIGLIEKSDKKDRSNHKHHAVDAMAIGLIDRSMLQKVSTLFGRGESRYLHKAEYEPYENFFEDAKASFEKIVVSYKPEHRKTGQFFAETAYGIKTDENGKEYLVTRKALTELSPKEASNIIDDKIRKDVEFIFSQHSEDKARKEALSAYAEANNIFKVRYSPKNSSYYPIKDKNGNVFKAYATEGYHHIDIYEKSDGSVAFEQATYHDVALQNKKYMPAWKRDKSNKILLRLHKKDVVKIDGDDRLFIVMKIVPSDTNQNFAISTVESAGKSDDILKDKDVTKYIGFKAVKKRGVQKVHVDEIGRVTPLRY